MDFYAADRIGYDAILQERFGIDTRTETAQLVRERVYFLLREKVLSEFGLFREKVPDPPAFCDHPDSKQFHEAQSQWQKRLCTLKRWTRIDELDEYLTAPAAQLIAAA